MSFVSSTQFSPAEESGIKVLVDGDPPLITIVSPINTNYHNSTPILINVSIFDHSLDSVWYSLNEDSNKTIREDIYLSLLEGEYYLVVYANDSFGRKSQSRVYFSVNNSRKTCSNFVCDVIAGENCNNCQQDCGICLPNEEQRNESSGNSDGSNTENIESQQNNQRNTNDTTSQNNISEDNPKEIDEDNQERQNTEFSWIPLLLLIILIIILITYLIYKKYTKKISKKSPIIKPIKNPIK